jgi:hypothetical protein
MMHVFLSSTIGKVKDPNARVYVKYADGTVDEVNPAKLREMVQK